MKNLKFIGVLLSMVMTFALQACSDEGVETLFGTWVGTWNIEEDDDHYTTTSVVILSEDFSFTETRTRYYTSGDNEYSETETSNGYFSYEEDPMRPMVKILYLNYSNGDNFMMFLKFKGNDKIQLSETDGEGNTYTSTFVRQN